MIALIQFHRAHRQQQKRHSIPKELGIENSAVNAINLLGEN
jgi:hypothetical protein